MHVTCRGARRGKSKFFFGLAYQGVVTIRQPYLISYPCLFPRCEAQFAHEALLEQHMARHFGLNLENISAGGALSGHSNLDPGDCHEALGATSGFTPSAGPSIPHMGNDLSRPTTQQESRIALDNDSIRTGSANAKKKYNCGGPNCNKGFNRRSDRQRHQETHYTTGKVKLFECPEFGCNRKAEWGFSRRDKIVDHIRAKHKRSVGKDEFRKPYWSYWQEQNEWLESNGIY